MDVTEIRRRNVSLLIDQSGGPTEFGRRIERDQAQVSQWTSAANPKPIGGRLARHIESKVGQSDGWLDAPHFATKSAPESHSQSVRPDPEIVRDVARALQEVFAELGYEPFDPAKLDDAELFVELYQRVLARGDISSGSNMVWLGTRIKERARLGAPSDERSKGTHGKGSPAGDARGRQKKA
jgi:hypothetical protein